MGSVISCIKRPKTTSIPRTARARITHELSPSNTIAITPTTLVNVNPFRLLDLPPELVDRVTTFVNSETMLPVRLACKVLEGITFDRFATENFEHVYCWVPTTVDFRRLREILDESPRLSSRIRRLTLTADILKDQHSSAMNYVRQRRESEDNARRYAIQSLNDSFYRRNVIVFSILRILQEISRLPQDVSIAVDLLARPVWRNATVDTFLPPQDVLCSLAMSRMEIHSLKLDQFTFRGSDGLHSFSRAELLAPMSALTTVDFRYIGMLSTTCMLIYCDLLQGALRLQSLVLEVGGFRGGQERTISLIHLPPEVLLANRLSYLTGLKIARAVIDGESLIEALRRCHMTLTHLVLRYVALSTDDEDMMPVCRELLGMPELVFLELHMLKTRVFGPNHFFKIPDHGVYPEDRLYVHGGKERIKEGLQELLDNHLYLHE